MAKILHVCESVRGGTGTYLNELLPLQIAEHGIHAIRLLGPRQHRDQTPDIPTGSLRFFHRPSRLKGLPFLLIALLVQIVTDRPDIIHAHSSFAGVLARLAAFVFRIPSVYCPHGWAVDREQSRLATRLIVFAERRLARISARLIAVSLYEREAGLSLGIAPDKIVAIQNCVKATPPAYSPIAWDDPRIRLLFVGRLDRQKGIDILLEAIKGLEDKITLRVIGDSVVGTTEIDFALYPHVEHLSWGDAATVAAQMAACDAVVMPSRWEGFSMVTLETARLKKALIASRVGGTPEILKDGVSGYLFEREDTQALHKILGSLDRATLEAFGQKNYEIFRAGFTSDKMHQAVERVYNTILKN